MPSVSSWHNRLLSINNLGDVVIRSKSLASAEPLLPPDDSEHLCGLRLTSVLYRVLTSRTTTKSSSSVVFCFVNLTNKLSRS